MILNSTTRYGLISRLLHWTMAVMILSMIGIGAYMSDLSDSDPSRSQLYGLHKSVGVTLLILAIIRIVWIMLSNPPPHSQALKRIEIVLAKSVIGLLYMLMLATPIVGYLMSNANGSMINYFGLMNLPTLIGPNHDLSENLEVVHAILAFSILGLVALHMAGAIKHRLFSKDPEADVLKRML